MTGGGTSCNSSNIAVGINSSTLNIPYTLYRGASVIGTQMGTGAALNWNQNIAGTYTVKSSVGLGCERTMSGSVSITTISTPTTLTIGGGGTCTGAPGVSVSLPGSQTGVSYQLKLNGVAFQAPKNGVGGTLLWNNLFDLGNYTIDATKSGCSGVFPMNGTAVIGGNPTALTVVGGGNYCVGSTGPTVKIYGPQLNVNYQLKINGVNSGAPKPGTGGTDLEWTNQTAIGTYTIRATSNGGCFRDMIGSVVVGSLPAPDLRTVSGGGGYCVGEPGPSVILENSQGGVNYQLRLNGVNTGSVVAGTGGTLTWPNLTTLGTYTVIGTLTSSSCARQMDGSAVVSSATPPAVVTSVNGLNINFKDEGSLLEVVGSADATDFVWSGPGVFPDAGGSVPGRKVIATPNVTGNLVFTVTPRKNGCPGTAFNVNYTSLSRTLINANSEKVVWTGITELDPDPSTFLFLPRHSSNYNGCIDEFKELTVYAKLDLGEDYNLGENAFTGTATVELNLYSDIPGQFQSWTVPLTIDQNGPEQLFMKKAYH